MAGFLGSGDLYFNRKVDGVDGGWEAFGNATKFEIKENAEIKERKSKQKSNYGQVIDSAPIKGSAEISITLDDFDKANLALIFLGTVSTVAVTGGTSTSEPQTAKLGKLIQLDFRAATNIVVKDVTDITTYVLGTDYEVVNAELGLIKILAGVTILDDAVLHITYDYGTVAGNKVTGGTDASIRVALMLDGENFADQSKVLANVWQADLSPQSGVDFLADDFATLELSGTLTTPTGQSASYEIETDVVYT